MKTLIFGAGPLGSLYASMLHKAGKDVTILARNDHFNFLKKTGIVLKNEFTQETSIANVNVVNSLGEDDSYDLVIVLMRKNQLIKVLPTLGKKEKIGNFLFLGNNALGFGEYLKHLPKEQVLFGFPGGGGSRIDHVVHYVDSQKPKGRRLPLTIGEIGGHSTARTLRIKSLFESSGVPVSIVSDIDSWLKYHVAFVNPLAGALLKCGDNYTLAKDKETIRTYIRSVNEGRRVLRALGYKKSYNTKLELFHLFPEVLLVKILKNVFNTKFAEIAMTMHAKAAGDEMLELAAEFKTLASKAAIKTPNIDELINAIPSIKEEAY